MLSGTYLRMNLPWLELVKPRESNITRLTSPTVLSSSKELGPLWRTEISGFAASGVVMPVPQAGFEKIIQPACQFGEPTAPQVGVDVLVVVEAQIVTHPLRLIASILVRATSEANSLVMLPT